LSYWPIFDTTAKSPKNATKTKPTLQNRVGKVLLTLASFFAQFMFGSFAFVFAVFVKFHFWDSAHRTYFCAIVALSAGCAFHPEIFSFGLFGHNVSFSDGTVKSLKNA
jgi:hypothetical protein